MIVNPDSTPQRLEYLIANSDYSLLIKPDSVQERSGGSYPGEKVLAYTSGTTGDSKFYSFSKQQIEHCCRHMITSYNITANDRYVGVMPLWHAHGQAWYWATKIAGCETHFLPIKQLGNMSDHAPTFISAIPDMIKVLTRQRFQSLRFVRTASAPLPMVSYEKFLAHFGVPVIEAFGMTESYSQCFTNPLHGLQKPGTIGLPCGVEAKIDHGHLWIRGPAVFTDQWFDTQDLAEQDSDGYFKILGRAQDRLNVHGFKLDPLSLETKLLQALPELDECSVFGTDAVKCVYVGPYDRDQVRSILIDLGQHCRPALLQQVSVIPKNPAGKISRSLLDQIYQ
jgi:acyl-coenzyme A synthetase/AMP-(fatty) acid ligase